MVRFRMRRFKLMDCFKGRHCLRKPVSLTIDSAQLHQCFRQIGLQRNRRFKRCDGFREHPFVPIRHTDTVVGVDERSIARECLLEFSDCLI